MPSRHTIVLPAEWVPNFPQRCVLCGGRAPNSTCSVTLQTPGGAGYIRWNAPACGSCLAREQRARRVRWIGSGIACALPLFYLVADASLAVVFASVLLLLGWIAVLLAMRIRDWLRPSAFQCECEGSKVEYTFRDRDFADEFRKANAGPEPVQRLDLGPARMGDLVFALGALVLASIGAGAGVTAMLVTAVGFGIAFFARRMFAKRSPRGRSLISTNTAGIERRARPARPSPHSRPHP